MPLIVVADDDPRILELIEYNLRLEGYEVVTTLDGEKALAAIIENKPDLILLDIMMPVQDGLQILAKLKRNDTTKDIPVWMLTAKGKVGDVEFAISLGADSYIIKPFDPNVLIKKISTVIGKVTNR